MNLLRLLCALAFILPAISAPIPRRLAVRKRDEIRDKDALIDDLINALYKTNPTLLNQVLTGQAADPKPTEWTVTRTVAAAFPSGTSVDSILSFLGLPDSNTTVVIIQSPSNSSVSDTGSSDGSAPTSTPTISTSSAVATGPTATSDPVAAATGILGIEKESLDKLKGELKGGSLFKKEGQ
ncbi:hypothetical protein C8J56DRAFT_918385 [Mycena floridula]|nr:hypothetical protein C8J56DRAFT_918385 [Mycena floridula]